MNIGFLGAGTVAQTIAKHALAHGHEVMVSKSRGVETLAALVAELGTGASAGTPQQAAEQQLVVLAVGWPNVQSSLSAVADWSGRVLVDATNRFASYTPPKLGDIYGRTSSEIVADLAFGAKVVKAFSSVPMSMDIPKPRPSAPGARRLHSGPAAIGPQPLTAKCHASRTRGMNEMKGAGAVPDRVNLV